jgi:acetoin utilization protein AcuB
MRSCMTRGLITIAPEQPLAAAHALMREHHVRHLPVLRGETLVGLVSQRDLYLLETLGDVDVEQVQVEEAMSPPFAVGPDEPLGAVLDAMLEHHYGSAVVLEGGRVIGIFTTTDAIRLLRETLSAQRR